MESALKKKRKGYGGKDLQKRKVYVICLFFPHQERETQFKKAKTTVWIKWPTQGCATYV